MKNLLRTLLFAAVPVVSYAQVTNNTCSTAGVLIPNTGIECTNTTTGTMSGSALIANPTSVCSFTAYKDVWFEFTATALQHSVEISSASLPDDNQAALALEVYSDCTTFLFCGDENVFASGLTIGQLYKVRVVASQTAINANFTLCVTTPVTIRVSTDEHTTQQLVNNILLGNTCQQATNITSSTGTDFNSVSGIGYFEKANSNFELTEGIILSSGNVYNATRPMSQWVPTGGPGWPGDADLTAMMNTIGTGPAQSQNASSIEFDFIPLKDYISLDYIFASNEYGMFQCNWGDAIAFLLTDMTLETAPVNIAVIPGTSTPVSVATIRDNANNSQCPSVNADYFGEYYTPTSATAPIGIKGATVVMTAEASVQPGHLYHLKLAIADRADGQYDSSVFIAAGSFNIGTPADIQITSSNGQALCQGESTILSVPSLDGYSYFWEINGDPLPGSSASITVQQFGQYSVTISDGNECAATRSISIVQGDGIPGALAITDYQVAEEDNNGFELFELDSKTAEINAQLNTPSAYTITYHETEQDAELNANSLPEEYTNITNPQTIYARIQKSDADCYEVFSFNLIVDSITGIADNAFSSLRLYPNPASSILTIENANGIDSVSVTNTLGQKVFTKAVNSSTAQIDVSSLSKGIYFVTVASGNASKTVKIIKE
jgi:hypothetical protein